MRWVACVVEALNAKLVGVDNTFWLGSEVAVILLRGIDNCSMIDRHNRIRQDDLGIERKYGTHSWSTRVNMSLFAMCVVDAYLLYKATTESTEPPSVFFWKLATAMMDNETHSRCARASFETRKRPPDPSPPLGEGLHVTPTKIKVKRPRTVNGKKVMYDGKPVMAQRRDQQRCEVCRALTTWTCSDCVTKDGKPVHIHHPKTGHQCWPAHVNNTHLNPSCTEVDPETLFEPV